MPKTKKSECKQRIFTSANNKCTQNTQVQVSLITTVHRIHVQVGLNCLEQVLQLTFCVLSPWIDVAGKPFSDSQRSKESASLLVFTKTKVKACYKNK